MTQVAQQIPSGWKVMKISDVCEIINGKTPLRNNKDYWHNGNIPWFTVDDIRNQGRRINRTGQHISELGLKKSGLKLLPENTILICCTASVGEYAITTMPLTTNQQFNGLIIKDRKQVSPDFLFQAAAQFERQLKFLMGTTAFGFVSKSQLGSIEFLAPPLQEQIRIATILSKVDEEIEKVERIIEQTEKLKKGLMQKLLTKGIGHTKFKQSELGEIPEEWEIKNFIDFATLQRGFDLPKQSRTEGRHPLVSSNGVTDEISEYKVKAPGVVTGRSGTIGKVFYIDKDFWPLNTTLYIKNFHGNEEKFVCYAILHFDLNTYHTGTGVPTLNRNVVHSKKIAVPQVDEQERIVAILGAIDKKLTAYEKNKSKFLKLKKGLMSDLLSGRVRTLAD